jgi:hypothetical protein
LLLSGSVVAQEHANVVIDYVAPPQCPLAATFQTNVASRLPRGRSVNLGTLSKPVNSDLGLQVRVVETQAGYRAELVTFTRDGRSSPRTLVGPVCSELMDAMAFTAALTVDPNATMLPTHAEPDSGKPGLDTLAGAANSSPEPPESPPPKAAAKARGVEEPPPVGEPSPFAVAAPPHVAKWATSVSAGVVLTAPITPSVSPGLLASVRYSDEAPGLWSPSVAFALFGTQLLSAYSPNASFAGFGAHLEFCPSSFHDGYVTIRVCAAGQLTMLRGSGENFSVSKQVTIALPSLGAHFELRHALSERWFVAGLAGAQLGLQRHRFDAGRPAEELASTRLVAPFVSLQLGAFF